METYSIHLFTLIQNEEIRSNLGLQNTKSVTEKSPCVQLETKKTVRAGEQDCFLGEKLMGTNSWWRSQQSARMNGQRQMLELRVRGEQAGWRPGPAVLPKRSFVTFLLTGKKEMQTQENYLMTRIFIFYLHHRGNAASYCVCYRCRSVNLIPLWWRLLVFELAPQWQNQ